MKVQVISLMKDVHKNNCNSTLAFFSPLLFRHNFIIPKLLLGCTLKIFQCTLKISHLKIGDLDGFHGSIVSMKFFANNGVCIFKFERGDYFCSRKIDQHALKNVTSVFNVIISLVTRFSHFSSFVASLWCEHNLYNDVIHVFSLAFCYPPNHWKIDVTDVRH